MEFDYEKFKDLIHYICHIADRDELGATKLNKILWYTDTISFINRGIPVTGATYIKEQWGPIPQALLPAIDDLAGEDKILVRDIPYYGKRKREYITLVEPDVGRFDAAEIDLASQITHIICHHHTAESISDLTHDRIWELAEKGEEIPYFAVLAEPLGEITDDYIQWAKESIIENEQAYNLERFNAGSSDKGK